LKKKLLRFFEGHVRAKKRGSTASGILCKLCPVSVQKMVEFVAHGHERDPKSAIIAQKIKQKSCKFDRYILRYFAILQYEF
jgi:hypothetical protein